MNVLARVAADLRVNQAFFDLLAGSYARFMGASLLPSTRGAAWLYHEAPLVVVAHDNAADPVFVYANRAAQICFEYLWVEFTALPSRCSVPSIDLSERERLLDEVERAGFVCGYSGWHVAKSGHRFRVANGVVWQLVDRGGVVYGQAAMFPLSS